jgi:hypothetical protein
LNFDNERSEALPVSSVPGGLNTPQMGAAAFGSKAAGFDLLSLSELFSLIRITAAV